MAPEKLDSPSNVIALAERVAALVEITDVRLIAAEMRSGPKPSGKLRAELARSTESHADLDSKAITVAVSLALRGECDAPEPAAGDQPKGEPAISIQAKYLLRYTLAEMPALTKAETDAFGDLNGVYNVWPFWREFVYSSLARMGLPPLVLPVLRITDVVAKAAPTRRTKSKS